MQILLIEDTTTGTTIAVQQLSPYGRVHAARNLVEARAVMDSGSGIDAIVTDMHLGDRRSWQDTIADVVELAKGRPVAAHTTDVYLEMRQEFAMLFSGHAELFSKRDAKGLIEWLQQFREDQAGKMVRTMDHGSMQSHRDIRAEVVAWLHDLGFPQPVEYNLRRVIESALSTWRRVNGLRDLAVTTVLMLMVSGLAAFIANAVWSAMQVPK